MIEKMENFIYKHTEKHYKVKKTPGRLFQFKRGGLIRNAEKSRLTTGRNGLVVCISQFEDFSASFVDVTFSEVQ